MIGDRVRGQLGPHHLRPKETDSRSRVGGVGLLHRISNLAYVSAVAADALDAKRTADPARFASAFESEREWQQRWLRDRLGIAGVMPAG